MPVAFVGETSGNPSRGATRRWDGRGRTRIDLLRPEHSFFSSQRHQSTVIFKVCDCGNRIRRRAVYSRGTAERNWTSRLASEVRRNIRPEEPVDSDEDTDTNSRPRTFVPANGSHCLATRRFRTKLHSTGDPILRYPPTGYRTEFPRVSFTRTRVLGLSMLCRNRSITSCRGFLAISFIYKFFRL